MAKNKIMVAGNLARAISRIGDFFSEDHLYSFGLNRSGPLVSFPARLVRVAALAVHGFLKDNCSIRAASLTYYSLLSIVPVFAMAFGIAKGFGLQTLIEKQILGMAEKANWPDEVVSRVLSFSQSLLESTKGGVIAGLGFILLVWSVVSILGQIEASFNHIWEVKKPRSLVRKFTDYTSIVVLAPILLLVSSSAAVLVSGKIGAMIKGSELLGHLGGLIFFLLKVLPYLSMWLVLFLCYLVIPNTRVTIKSAIVAGVAAGTTYQIIQLIYIRFQIGVAGYGAVYGSFAALPLLIGWLNLSWMIVLFGAEIAHAYDNHETYGFHPDYSRMSTTHKRTIVLKVFHLLARRFLKGEAPMSPTQISHATQIPARLVRQILSELGQASLVTETTGQVNHEHTFQPARSVEEVTIQNILSAYERVGTHPIPLDDRIGSHIDNISMACEKTPENLRLKDIDSSE